MSEEKPGFYEGSPQAAAEALGVSGPPSPGRTEERLRIIETSVQLLADMHDEQSEQIGNLYALIEKLNPPGPIVPQAPIVSFAERLAAKSKP